MYFTLTNTNNSVTIQSKKGVVVLNEKNHIISVPNVKKIGVYAIHNISNDKYYVGSSVNINARMKTHRSNIEKLNGSNLKFDEDLKSEEDIKNFEFIVIETFEDYQITECELRKKEEEYIKKYDAYNGYNVEGRNPFINGYFGKNEYLFCKKYNRPKRKLNMNDVRRMTNREILHRYTNLLSKNSDNKYKTSINILEYEILKRMDNK